MSSAPTVLACPRRPARRGLLDKLNAEYGESAGGGIRAGKQGPLFEGGAEYLNRNFPRLDYIVRATVVER